MALNNKTLDEFVFKKKPCGSLEFVGDFDAVYRNRVDPWSQSESSNDGWREYYQHSRLKILNSISPTDKNILEVGCGIGYVVDFLNKKIEGCSIDGMDISSEAIILANKNFPELNFFVGDITNSNHNISKKYNVIVLNQILWYILGSLDQVVKNVYHTLEDAGLLIVSQAFFKDYQSYGRDILVGVDGLEDYMLRKHGGLFKLENIKVSASNKLVHDDGLLVFKKLKI